MDWAFNCKAIHELIYLKQVEDKMREMVSADENGDLYYESADYAPDISDYLAKKSRSDFRNGCKRKSS